MLKFVYVIFIVHQLLYCDFMKRKEPSVQGLEKKRIEAMEMRCYRKILRISFKDHITSQESRNKVEAAMGPYEVLLTTVKKRKLQ